MFIELYRSDDEIPAIYDAYLDKEGTLWGMSPQPPQLHDLIQVVVEATGPNMTKAQHDAVNFLIKFNNARAVDRFTYVPSPVGNFHFYTIEPYYHL
ncbi:hypothetical protein Rleg2_1120 [Rhizobium leguminosarum bv. trifolii WSM2304]|uniref:Uncharacterized protein n=1 Tax=Rhizobium leguminosarum bv. trifolii (strain WSM2304) TaxID=395492 RepID=A0ABF7QKC3_RHILW|nr:hypothetical protein [Rhizobium leguminosarum]ACI54414.1 hypothetical protein Rleg2_1120 [Rhizobium leguminosarum bv. trifolii WSM2304]